MSVTVVPGGELERGMTITITCTVSYGGPTNVDHFGTDHDPELSLTLDGESTFPAGQVYYNPPPDVLNLYTKHLVIVFILSSYNLHTVFSNSPFSCKYDE